ncbi:MAG: hypothetical protein ACKOAY_12535 [Haliscomenobacter sp.]
MQDYTFLFGLLGGLLPDAIRIVNNRYNPSLPDYLKSANFYIGTTILVLLGGAAAWLTEADSVVDALAMGFSAPQIISSIMQQKANVVTEPTIPVSPLIGGEPGTRGFDVPGTKSIPESNKTGIRNWWGM